MGYGDILDEVHARWKAGYRAGAEAAIPKRMVEDLYVFGTVEECRAHIGRFVRLGFNCRWWLHRPSSRLTGDDFQGLLGAFGQ